MLPGGFEKIGPTEPIEVNVRIIAATHRELAQMISEGTFRDDLYHRLSVIPLEIPPLRERREDIPELVRHFFLVSKAKHKRADLKLPDSLERYFCAYRWPGNVGELENLIERLVVLALSDEITYQDLPLSIQKDEAAAVGAALDILVDVLRQKIKPMPESGQFSHGQTAGMPARGEVEMDGSSSNPADRPVPYLQPGNRFSNPQRTMYALVNGPTHHGGRAHTGCHGDRRQRPVSGGVPREAMLEPCIAAPR